MENAEKMGNYLMGGLRRIQEKYPVIGDVRGRGLMIATEFVDSAGEPSKTYTKAVQQACLSKNLLLLTCGTYENVIRWIPPLVVKRKQVDEALSIFEDAVAAL